MHRPTDLYGCALPVGKHGVYRGPAPDTHTIRMTIPNIITLLRFALVPLVVWGLLSGEVGIAFAAFLAAGISDGVDGFIARRFDQRSELGAWLDPIADKALLVATFAMLGALGALPLWLVVLVISRDLAIAAAVMVSSLIGYPVTIRPLFVSKANTTAQIVLAVVSLGSLAWFGPLPTIHAVLIAAVTTLTILSGLAYLRTWLNHMRALGVASAPPNKPPRSERTIARKERERVG